MALLGIRRCGDPILRRKAARLENLDGEVARLMDDMAETMVKAPGVGLAAPQVGALVRVIVALREETSLQVANPQIVRREGHVEGIEGCLSLPQLQGPVVRPEAIRLRGVDREGEERTWDLEGWLARIVCHETDHLDGKLFLDRVEGDEMHWLVDDETAENGHRLEPTTVEEAYAAFLRDYQERSRP
jgi:peptide deformylase